jgi:hypothetical protein
MILASTVHQMRKNAERNTKEKRRHIRKKEQNT